MKNLRDVFDLANIFYVNDQYIVIDQTFKMIFKNDDNKCVDKHVVVKNVVANESIVLTIDNVDVLLTIDKNAKSHYVAMHDDDADVVFEYEIYKCVDNDQYDFAMQINKFYDFDELPFDPNGNYFS